MVDAKTLVIGAAALALLMPERVGAAGVSAGSFAGGIAEGITALGTIRISPEFAPNISPRVVPEVGLRTDFPDWLDVSSYFPRIVTGTTITPRQANLVLDPEEEESTVPAETIEQEIERKYPDPEDDPYEG